MSAPPLTRLQELWLVKWQARREWTLPEALFWVIYRDAQRAGRGMEFGSSPLLAERASVLIGACLLLGSEADSHEEEPFEALGAEVMLGNVVAVGDVSQWSAGRTRIEVRPDFWERLRFFRDRYSGREDSGLMSLRESPDRLYLTGLRFEREGLLKAFPPIEAGGEPGPQRAARLDLEALCVAHYDQSAGPVPVGAVWREDVRERFRVGDRAARRIWAMVAVRYPRLSDKGGKPKSAGNVARKRRA